MTVPPLGWVRAIRDALSMSGSEMAARLGVAQQAVHELERSEANGTIKLETLRRAADALDCDLVYVLLPRQRLEFAVQTQARRQAARHLNRITHTSRLEDQVPDHDDSNDQLDDLSQRLIDRRGLWTVDASD